MGDGIQVLYVRPFSGADCANDHSLVLTKIRERLVVCKQTAQKFNVERFNLRKLSGLELRKQYQIRSQTDMQLWRIYMTVRTQIGLGKT